MIGYLFIAGTVLFTVYAQLVFKWQVDDLGDFPTAFSDRLGFVVSFLLNLWIVSSFVALFLGSLSWIGVLIHFELSFAYPFTSLSFVLVLVLSVILFGESLSVAKIAGLGLIMIGVWVTSQV